MNRMFLPVLAMVIVGTMMISACAQATPAPAPPVAPSEPAKAPAAAPTAVPAAPSAPAQPTAVPAAKVDFPQKGKAITILVSNPAGGGNDVVARLLAPHLEKELGVPIQVVNKVGAGGQVGYTEVAQSKPDGYLMGQTGDVSLISMYLQPDRKTTFGRKDFQQVAMQTVTLVSLLVKNDSPYKTAKDLVDAAKARPNEISIGVTAVLGDQHLAALAFQKAAGVKLRIVNFDGAPESMAALLGGHLDSIAPSLAAGMANIKAGQIRALGLFNKDRDPANPDIPTLKEQGFDANMPVSRGYSVPNGTPKEIVGILSDAIGRAMQNKELQTRMTESGAPPAFMGAAEYSKFFDEMEATIRPLVQEALAEQGAKK